MNRDHAIRILVANVPLKDREAAIMKYLMDPQLFREALKKRLRWHRILKLKGA